MLDYQVSIIVTRRILFGLPFPFYAFGIGTVQPNPPCPQAS